MILKCEKCASCEDVYIRKMIDDAHDHADIAVNFFLLFIGLIIVSLVIGYFESINKKNDY